LRFAVLSEWSVLLGRHLRGYVPLGILLQRYLLLSPQSLLHGYDAGLLLWSCRVAVLRRRLLRYQLPVPGCEHEHMRELRLESTRRAAVYTGEEVSREPV
jgi:hypothetical protein